MLLFPFLSLAFSVRPFSSMLVSVGEQEFLVICRSVLCEWFPDLLSADFVSSFIACPQVAAMANELSVLRFLACHGSVELEAFS